VLGLAEISGLGMKTYDQLLSAYVALARKALYALKEQALQSVETARSLVGAWGKGDPSVLTPE